MHINFFDTNLNPLTQICDLLDFACESQLNDSGECTFALSYSDPHLTPQILTLGNHIQVIHTANSTKHILFEGIITSITQQNTKIIFQAVDYLGYLAYRLIEDEWDYSSGVDLNVLTTRIFNHTHNLVSLPFSMGTNDLEDEINFTLSKGTTALSALQKIAKIKGEFRVWDRKLDFTEQTGKTHSGLLSYDYLDGRSGNIIAWEWERDVSELANRILEKDSSGNYFITEDTDSIAQIGLFSKYVYTSSGATQTPKADIAPLPALTLDTTKLDWWDYQVGDRQNVQILTPLEYLNLEYLGIIQNIRIELKNQTPQVEIIISEKVKSNTNPLEQLSQRLADLES